MSDFITIPAPVYRAFKPLIKPSGSTRMRNRIAEFVRVGITAYDFTLTYSDHFMLIRCAWGKPKDWGNHLEGYFQHLTKEQFASVEYTAKYGARIPIIESPELPFRDDILKDSSVQSFIDLNQGSYCATKGKVIPCSSKKFNANLMAKTMQACSRICMHGDPDVKVDDAPLIVDFGAGATVPAYIHAYVRKHDVTLDALVMPLR